MTQRVTKNRKVTLSEKHCLELNINPGDVVQTYVEDGMLHIVKKEDHPGKRDTIDSLNKSKLPDKA